ncbi:MAG: hypothetical protein MAG453_00498 [Calditrichaeota bacterium]|nr:hypothetical protein [Calditrichota bacterium]
MVRNSVVALSVFLLVSVAPLPAQEITELAITVYNQDIGLVRELRTLALDEGVQEYAYDGVAAKIIPTSVRFHADRVDILEQNFEYDLVDRNALLEKYLGEMVDVMLKEETVRGRLLSAQGGLILEEDAGSVRMIDTGEVISVRFPELPEGLIIRPTLRWRLDSGVSGTVESELNYLTRGLDWEASYVAVIGEDDKRLELSGWVQVTNESGADYENAKLKLMAGDVRFAERRPQRPQFEADMMRAAGAAKQFEEKEFFEYHLYTLPRRVSVLDRQVKQIRLIEPSATDVDKRYTFEPWRGNDVSVDLEFVNSEPAGLGMPLPAGLVRMYKQDEDGSLQLIGEDRIDHTPRDERIRLSTGSAFDIVAERTKTSTERIGPRAREESYEVELRNRKDEDVEVIVRERFGGDWRIMQESREGKKTDAYHYEWVVPVPARSVVTLSYRVRMQ